MRILKYIFLLILLSIVALTIFIATQKSEFVITRSKIINSPKTSVFNFVNDYRNWTDFSYWTMDDTEMKFSYSTSTIGKNAFFSWSGEEDEGRIQTNFIKDTDSISQILEYNGNPSTLHWSFKDTIGGTKVTSTAKGRINFFFKVSSAWKGGVYKVLGSLYEKNLANLDRALDYEINTYNIKIIGQVKQNAFYYTGQSFTSELSKLNKNFKIVSSKILKFCKQNNIQISGKPFIIYHTFDINNGIAKVTIGYPIKEEILISPGSDIEAGKIDNFSAVKTILTGDYNHTQEAYNNTLKFLDINTLYSSPIFDHIEVYSISKTEIKNPSKWKTDIYIPIISQETPLPKPNLPVNKNENQLINDSITVNIN